MPDPIPSDPAPVEPKKKSGFDPHEYEAEIAADNPETEIPIQMRMYRDAIAITRQRINDLMQKIRDGTFKPTQPEHSRYEGWKHLYGPDGTNRKEFPETMNSLFFQRGDRENKIISHPISSLSNAFFRVEGVFLPGKDRKFPDINHSFRYTNGKQEEDEDFVVIKISLVPGENEESVLQDQILAPHGGSDDFRVGDFLILLSPEMKPTIIQERPWDKINKTWAQKLATSRYYGQPKHSVTEVYPRYDITDEECTAILKAIATAPL